MIACAPIMTVRNPEPQTWLMVTAVDSLDKPDFRATWRATFWPSPALNTFPKITCSTFFGSKSIEASVSFNTSTPKSTAEMLLNWPPNFPIAERFAATMTTSSIKLSFTIHSFS